MLSPIQVESVTPVFEDGVLTQIDITYSGLRPGALYFLDQGTDLQSFPLKANCVFAADCTFVISDFNSPSGPGAKAFYRLTESSGFLRK